MWFNFRAASSVFIFFRSLAHCNGAWGGAIGSGYRAAGCKGALTEVLTGFVGS